MCPRPNSAADKISIYIRRHEASLGTLLSAYGAFFLTAVILGGWTWTDWGVDVFTFPQTAIQPLMPRSFISPFFFVTSFPALLIGVVLMCDCSIRGLRFGLTATSQYIAVLLSVFGFSYLVIGAWPLQVPIDMPWEWQKQIMSYGAFFAWLLYGLGFVVFAVGGVSLFVHSRAYRRRHPELVDTFE
ncbi:MAG: hypothetical protein ACQCN4_00495 [Candidatus Bathyarchaeia archaeon]|jgi:hypothetical protein